MAASITAIGCAVPVKDGTGPPGEAKGVALGVREAIALAFDEIGGVQALSKWAKTNDETRKAFYIQFWLKIMSAEEKGTGDHKPLEEIRMTVVDPGA